MWYDHPMNNVALWDCTRRLNMAAAFPQEEDLHNYFVVKLENRQPGRTAWRMASIDYKL